MYKLYKEHLKEAYECRNATLLSSRIEAYDMGARLYFTWCWMEWDKRCNYLENLSLLQKNILQRVRRRPLLFSRGNSFSYNGKDT